jgi:hypothetical protein
MATIAYTCKYVTPFNKKEAEKRKLKEASDKVCEAKQRYLAAHARMEECLKELNYALTAVACEQQRYENTVDEFNVKVHDVVDMLRGCMTAEDHHEDAHDDHADSEDAREDDCEDDREDDCEDPADAMWHNRFSGKNRQRFTRRDVLSPQEACKAGKASKRHKLIVKVADKVADNTRKLEAKAMSKTKATTKAYRIPVVFV